MANEIIIAKDPLNPDSWETHYKNDLLSFLTSVYNVFPVNARIYHKQVSELTDVTPRSDKEIDKLSELTGRFYVVEYPEDPVTVVVAVVAVITAVASFIYASNIPTPTQRNTQSESPNNELSSRTNKPRIGSRIPDIFGTVRSTPDLLSVPYKVFENHVEVEYAYMAISRGFLDIAANDIKDDTTKIQDIVGSSVNIYGPNTSPNSGSPQLIVGSLINEPLFITSRSNAVNGQELRAPNSASVIGNNDLKFLSNGTIVATTSNIDFTDKFESGDSLVISNANYSANISGEAESEVTASVSFSGSGFVEFASAGVIAEAGDIVTINRALFVYDDGSGEPRLIDLNGTYTVTGGDSTGMFLSNPGSVNSDWNFITGNFPSDKTPFKNVDIIINPPQQSVTLNGTYSIVGVSTDTVFLSNPNLVNPDWDNISDYPSNETGPISANLVTTGNKIVGWFNFDLPQVDHVYFNFIALNGLYKDDGKKQIKMDVEVAISIQEIDNAGNGIGPVEVFDTILEGSSTTKGTRAVTLKVTPSFSGPCRVRAWRRTPSDLDFEGSIVDEVKWRDAYAMREVTTPHFGNLTTVMSSTLATDGALAVKERKLNMLATRVSGRNYTPINSNNGNFGNFTTYNSSTLEASQLTVVQSTNGQYGVGYALGQGYTTGSTVVVTVTLTGASASNTFAVIKTSSGNMSNISQCSEGSNKFLFTLTGSQTGAYLYIYNSVNSSFVINELNIGAGYLVTDNMLPVKRIDDVLFYQSVDPYIGFRTADEIDFDQIYSKVQEGISYFGSDEFVEFNYTLDSDNLSFEETVSLTAKAGFFRAYRRGKEIKLNLEKIQLTPVLLFNHRNKVPNSESRTIQFGGMSDNDGIEYEWVSSDNDDGIETIYIPADRSAINPRKIESIGVRNSSQAYAHAYRLWNKLKYQTTAIKFTGTQESDLLVLDNKILCEDNTRTLSFDGEVVGQNGLVLTLSQNVTLDPLLSYSIFLQYADATVESIPITEGPMTNEIVLSYAPKLPLSLDSNLYAKTTYMIQSSDNKIPKEFLLTEKSSKSDFTSDITAINYSDLYYQADSLFCRPLMLNDVWYDAANGENTVNLRAGVTVGVDSKYGEYFNLNTSSEWVEILVNKETPESYTKMALIQPQALTGSQAISATFTGAGNPESFRLAGSQIQMAHGWPVDSNNSLGAAYTANAGEWCVVMCTYNHLTQEAKLFVNGVKVAERNNLAQRDLNKDFHIGAFGSGGSNTFIGKIAQFRYYGRVFSESEIDLFTRLILSNNIKF